MSFLTPLITTIDFDADFVDADFVLRMIHQLQFLALMDNISWWMDELWEVIKPENCVIHISDVFILSCMFYVEQCI